MVQKLNMVVTRKRQSTLRHPLSTRKINASSCAQKDFPTNLWCANCNDSINLGDRKKALPCKKPWQIDLNSCSFNQKRHYYLIEDFKERHLLNMMVPSRKKTRISLDTSSDTNNTTTKYLDRKVKNSSKCCVGIVDSTDDKIKLYIAESLRSTASLYEYDATLKINGLLPQNDSIKKREIMSSIFTGVGIKTTDGVNIIEDCDGEFNLRSSECDVHFSNNDIYDSLSLRCKSCRSLCIKFKNKLNRLTPPAENISKFSRIDSISKNPVKSNIEICRLRKENVNLRRKMARLVNAQKLKEVSQTIDNVSDTSL